MRLSACSRKYSSFSSFVFSCMLSSVVCCTAVSLCSICFLLHAEVYSTHHGCQALWFVNQGCWWNLVGIRVTVLCIGKPVTGGYVLKKVLKQLTVQSLEFSASFTVKRIGTVAILSTTDTERNGDSPRTCSNDEHVAGTTARLESRNLDVDS